MRILQVFIVSGLLFTAACVLPSDPAAPKEVGVSKSGSDVVGLFNPCRGGRSVDAIRMLVSGGKAGSLDDRVIWEVTSTGAQLQDFVVGETPPGFMLSTPLEGSIPDGTLIMSVQFDGKQTVVAFRTSELREGEFRIAGNKFMSREAYAVADTCKLTN